jgi:hypothetical protein
VAEGNLVPISVFRVGPNEDWYKLALIFDEAFEFLCRFIGTVHPVGDKGTINLVGVQLDNGLAFRELSLELSDFSIVVISEIT